MKKRLNYLLSYIKSVNIEKRMGEKLPLLEVNIRNGKYVLDGEKVNYSFGSLHDLFSDSFKKTHIKDKVIHDALILGFGAGSVADILTNELKMNCRIKGVEKDPVVIQLARKYFKVDDLKDTTIACEDAFNFIASDTELYDLIVIDLFVENRVPMIFLMKDFIAQVNLRLRPGGSVFFNKINDDAFQEDETSRLIQTMKEEFKGDVDKLLFRKYGTSNCMLVYHNK